MSTGIIISIAIINNINITINDIDIIHSILNSVNESWHEIGCKANCVYFGAIEIKRRIKMILKVGK